MNNIPARGQIWYHKTETDSVVHVLYASKKKNTITVKVLAPENCPNFGKRLISNLDTFNQYFNLVDL